MKLGDPPTFWWIVIGPKFAGSKNRRPIIFQWLGPKASQWIFAAANIPPGLRSCCATPSARNFQEPAGSQALHRFGCYFVEVVSFLAESEMILPEMMNWCLPNNGNPPDFSICFREVYRNSTEKLALLIFVVWRRLFLDSWSLPSWPQILLQREGLKLPGEPFPLRDPAVPGSSRSSPWRAMRRRRCRRWTDGQRRRETSKCRRTWASRPTWEAWHGGFLKWGYPQSSSLWVGFSIVNHPFWVRLF